MIAAPFVYAAAASYQQVAATLNCVCGLSDITRPSRTHVRRTLSLACPLFLLFFSGIVAAPQCCAFPPHRPSTISYRKLTADSAELPPMTDDEVQ